MWADYHCFFCGNNNQLIVVTQKILHRENKYKMHLKRWLTGIIVLPILIYAIDSPPGWIFYFILLLASITGLTEFYRITAPDLSKRIKWSGYALSLVLFLVILTENIYLLPAVIVFLAFVPMFLFVILPYSPGPHLAGDIGKGLFGPIYVCLPIYLLIIIVQNPKGDLWIFFLLTVIFASDTGAFYCGRQLGKHKLHKTLSPGKTWEGSVGGILTSIIVSLGFLHLTHLREIDLHILALVVCLSIIGQIGDLAESMLKRGRGIKDSGTILPGHGGLLDRIDGLLFAIPVLYMYFHFYRL